MCHQWEVSRVRRLYLSEADGTVAEPIMTLEMMVTMLEANVMLILATFTSCSTFDTTLDTWTRRTRRTGGQEDTESLSWSQEAWVNRCQCKHSPLSHSACCWWTLWAAPLHQMHFLLKQHTNGPFCHFLSQLCDISQIKTQIQVHFPVLCHF